MPRIASDHNPLLFSSLTGPKPFRFSSPWIRHPEFLETVSNSWKKPSFANCPMVKIQAKLKQLKIDLKKWNNETFGNIHTRVASAKDSLLKV